jgi:inosose dehydratase
MGGLTAMVRATILHRVGALQFFEALQTEETEETIEVPKHTSRRLAGAPISWGVCEVPGWGRQLAPERVLAEMAGLGLTATELGPLGYLPLDGPALRAALDPHGLRLVGGFVPLVLQDLDRSAALDRARTIAAALAAAGADVFVAALVRDDAWSPPVALDDAQWARLVAGLGEVAEIAAAHGLELAVHPHWGTLLEREDAIERLLATSDVGWCLDTGHLLLAGIDPVEFAEAHGDRTVHVHLKDVDAAVAARLRAGELTLVEATQAGLFRPLGAGDARIQPVLRALARHGYERWLVLEQDTAITGPEPPVGSGPVVDVRQSIDFLDTVALEEERGVA